MCGIMDAAVSETGVHVREQPIPSSVVSWLSQFCHHHVSNHGGVRAGANSANASSGQGSRLLCGCFSMRVCARVGLSAGLHLRLRWIQSWVVARDHCVQVSTVPPLV